MTIGNLLFAAVIFSANILQGITGFAGTVLAMPPGILLVGYDAARPVLNALGFLASGVVFLSGLSRVRWRVLGGIVAVMILGTGIGLVLRSRLGEGRAVIRVVFGLYVAAVALWGLLRLFREKRSPAPPERKSQPSSRPVPGARIMAWAGDALLLICAGIAHGLFVSGGPLIIGYLARRIEERQAFRATISGVWMVLNGVVLADDLLGSVFTPALLSANWLCLPAVLGGVWLGSLLSKRISGFLFTLLTFLLLLASAATLLLT